MIDVCLLGTGGMMPLPGRFLTSLYVRYDGHAILIDCGEGTQTAIRIAGLRFKCIDAIFITHFHADHMVGLPGLLLSEKIVHVDGMFTLDLAFLVYWAILLLLSYVFRYGEELQQLSDETL